MDIKKLDKWAELLLDTGKRNNLISFKDTKASTIEVVYPTADALFDKIDGVASLEVFAPDFLHTEDDIPDEVGSESPDTELNFETIANRADGKSAYLNRYAAIAEQKNQVLLYHNETGPYTVLKNVENKAKQYTEETGINVAYMAFGFIHWKESDTSQFVYRAPVLLIPIRLERESLIKPYYIQSAGDDIVVNPTFSYKVDAEYGIKLPDYEDEGLTAYLDKVKSLVEKLHWKVSAECKIGIFSFLKINMYRDLKDNAKAILANKNIRALLGEPRGKNADADSMNQTDYHVANPLIELHNVVDADSSQLEAIEMAKSGRSLVLQGPPGTGKSQTITNMIAECLNDGKKVLFVSEKLAALNVVYEKLKQAGLSEFCLELHSHKANKKDVIADICRTLRLERCAVSSKAENEIAVKEKARQRLDAYVTELHKQRPVINMSLYQLYECLSPFNDAPNAEWAIPDLSANGEEYLREASSLLDQYVDYIPSIGYDFRKNPWYGYANRDTSYQTKAEVKNAFIRVVPFLESLTEVLSNISEKYRITCNSLTDARNWLAFFRAASDFQLITPALLERKQFEQACAALQPLQEQCMEIHTCQTALEDVFDEDIYKIDGAAYHKKLTKQYNSAFARVFHSEYRQMIKSLKQCRKKNTKLTYNTAVSLMDTLDRWAQKTDEFRQTEELVKPLLGEAYKGLQTDWDLLGKQMDVLRTLFESEKSFGNLIDCADFSSEHDSFADFAERLERCFDLCSESTLEYFAGLFDSSICSVYLTDSSAILDKCKQCVESMELLDNWCHFRTLLSNLEEMHLIPFIDAVISGNIPEQDIVRAFKKQFYFRWIDSIIAEEPVLSSFNRITQDKAVGTFAEKDREQFEINKAKIRAVLSADRPSSDMIASGSALAVLLREGEKKRKQKSIRTLLSETGELVQRIKPCFLMSPLSVSTFLASDAIHFDTVIFDEASQIFPQDAIGAIYRGEQLIVVGDSKQMPPSNFFNASVETDNDDEDVGDVTDFESILDLCSTSMRQLRLRWHYRSRYEPLIAFSNKNFYENDLITFPSAKADTLGTGVDYYYVNGTFDRKSHTNRKEAEYIVDLIYQNIEQYPERSIGVVAFSVAQQNLIDKLLQRRRQSTPEKEYFFTDSTKEAFFIKNLETVQGDERDTIIFSVAYGMDTQGRLLHNFGPLNRMGGERRLNVAVTRAKYNVQLVSSMHYTDIDLARTSAEGARLLREYLEFAEKGAVALEHTLTVGKFDQYDSDFELEVCQFLRSNGYAVDTQVGCSGYKIDLALKKPNSSDYYLAVECDGASYHSSKNARDRDRLRQEILERMGWNFYRIWSTDWFRNKPVEQQRLLDAAKGAVQKKTSPDKQNREKRIVDSFEEASAEKKLEFLPYRAAKIESLSRQYLPRDFLGMVEAILKVEAPLSEELLLKRIVGYFGREKVTSVVWREYEQKMRGCEARGVIRHDGFLYLRESGEIKFRAPGDITREIRQISIEEIAAGLYAILRENITVDKNGLYQSLARQCGVARVGKAICEYFDLALETLDSLIKTDGNQLSLK